MKTIKIFKVLFIIVLLGVFTQSHSNNEPNQVDDQKSTYNISLTITGQSTSCGYINLKLYKKVTSGGSFYWYKVGEANHYVDGTGTVNVPMNGIAAYGDMKLTCRYHSYEGNSTCPEALIGNSENEFFYTSGNIPATINLFRDIIE